MRCAALLLGLSLCAQDTRVILLGTGNPSPVPDRMGPATAVVSGGRVYVVDAGAGVVRRAVQAGLKAKDLNRLFLTHLHSDHTLGYPDFILTPGVMMRTEPLQVFGPKGTVTMTKHVMAAWKEDLDIRLHGGEPGKPEAYEVRPNEFKAGEIYRDEHVKVIAFPVKHGSWKEAYGFRFEAKDKVIVISGDTTYDPRMLDYAKGADILVHEVYCEAGFKTRPKEWQQYHVVFHTAATDLSRLAAQLKPKKLVLTHQLLMGSTPEQLLKEIRSTYNGEIVDGRDLDVIR